MIERTIRSSHSNRIDVDYHNVTFYYKLAAMMSNPAIQQMTQQMMSNPELLQNMMSSPYMEHSMSQLRNNPELANQMLSNNPLFTSNPQLAEAMRQNLPDMIQRVSWAKCVHYYIKMMYVLNVYCKFSAKIFFRIS